MISQYHDVWQYILKSVALYIPAQSLQGNKLYLGTTGDNRVATGWSISTRAYFA